MKISVIVPAYNSEKYIEKCIDSLLNQTLKDIEIIVINDCSTDNTKKILEGYKKNNNNIKIIHNKSNKGIGYNRNIGIKKAQGEYISFIDSDDYIDEKMYEKMYNKAKLDKLDIVMCNFHRMLEKADGNVIEIEAKHQIPCFDNTTLEDNPSLLLNVELAPWNKIYRKDLIEDITFPENLKYEDAVFVIKSMVKAKKIGMIDEKLNYYLVRNTSETGVMDKRVFDILTVMKIIVEELRSTDYYNAIEEYAEAMTIRNVFRYTLQQKNQKDKKVATDFIDQAFEFLNNEYPNWRKNKIYKKRNVLKRIIESSKFLTKIYCNKG